MLMQHPWEGRMAPFKMFGNLYFVGTRPASTHLIDTGDGLLILDSGFQESLYLVLEGIRSLGFNPHDIRWILHSHGHIDHAGATCALKDLTHAETYIGAGDADMVDGRRRALTYDGEFGMVFSEFTPDHLLHDGDRIQFGNTTVECYSTPGHTPGTMSFFWNVQGDDGRVLRAGTMGGAGLNTVAKAYVQAYGLESEDWRGAMKQSLLRCRDFSCEVFVGNHVQHNDTPGRYMRLIGGDPDAFVDTDAWPRAIAGFQRAFDAMVAKGE